MTLAIQGSFEVSLRLKAVECLYINRNCLIHVMSSSLRTIIFYHGDIKVRVYNGVESRNNTPYNASLQKPNLRALWKDKKLWEEFFYTSFLQMLSIW
jgi:hypothetical protein